MSKVVAPRPAGSPKIPSSEGRSYAELSDGDKEVSVKNLYLLFVAKLAGHDSDWLPPGCEKALADIRRRLVSLAGSCAVRLRYPKEETTPEQAVQDPPCAIAATSPDQ